jgi:2',3'-cyclic-nucleotide 2'-phosphodiesterase (5'-nucleotidase family)
MGFTLRFRPMLVLALAFALVLALAGPAGATGNQKGFWLTILHNNDGESKLLSPGAGLEDFGSIARFKTVVDMLKDEALTGPPSEAQRGFKRGVVMLSSGDNFLAGPEFNASLEKGVPFYDSIALELVGYDAFAIGNHEFDFGPDVLADFIVGIEKVPFLSANLDVSGEPALRALERRGRIAGAVVVRERGERIGIVGATTPALPFISSPRNVTVDPDVAGAIQGEVNRLERKGINKVILISHLQSVQEDLALAPQLRGIDVMIAGGGDELLANPGDLLVPGDVVAGPYPLTAMNAEGKTLPVITTPGDYKYVGELGVGFDRNGNIVAMNSGPVRVSGVAPDAVEPDPVVQALVADPVQAAVEALAQNQIAISEVPLDGRRVPGVRTQETNEGSLIADAHLHQARKLAPGFGVDVPQVALQNGGGIRNNNLIPAGPITELDTFSMLPFSNFICVVEDIPAAQFKEILENAVSRVEAGDGRFAQVAGFRFTWDANGTPQVLDADLNVVTPGTRIREVTLDDGTQIVSSGAVVSGAPSLDIATIDFNARGGDQYPFRGAPFTTLGISYQQSLLNYIVEPDGLNGLITAARYPEGGSGRITRLN